MDELPDPQAAVGDAMRLARRRLRLSQRDLAELLGWDRAKVGRWEIGEVAPALARVDAVLRGLGFRLAVVPTDPDAFADVEEPTPHIRDRGVRRFPAHLDHEIVEYRPISWWVRYRDADNPWAPMWTYHHLPPGPRVPAPDDEWLARWGPDAPPFPEVAGVADGEGTDADSGEEDGGLPVATVRDDAPPAPGAAFPFPS